MNRKIVHLSDLHCDGTPQWERNFRYMCDCVAKEQPDVIVITGDSVDQPENSNFDILISSIKKLIDQVQEKRKENKFYLVTIPGNHDFFRNGLKATDKDYVIKNSNNWFLSFFRKNEKKVDPDLKKIELFNSYLKKLLYPFPSYEELVQDIYNNLHLAFYPLDSNSTDENISLAAEGNVKDPARKLSYYNDIFSSLAGQDNLIRINIALLHHHPLPLPITPRKQNVEPFLILKNSYEFLAAAEEYQINLILHGHEHIGGISEYRTLNSRLPMTVFSCASSTKPSEAKREIKIINISESGAIFYKNYTSGDDIRSFGSHRKYKDIITYGEQRRNRLDKVLPELSNYQNIKNIQAKTKIVFLEDDGTASIKITHQGIKWQEKVTQDDMRVIEHLQSDVGRIHYGWKGICEEREHNCSLTIWKNPNAVKKKKERAVDSENFYLELTPSVSSYLNPTHRAHTEMEYPFFNGFALTKEDHEEIYGRWEEVRNEFCSIETKYKTELLELIVKFPSSEYMPEENDVKPIAIKNIKDDNLSYIQILHNNFDKHLEETNFLNIKLAKRFRKEFCEIALIVRHPQPDLLYTLIWRLPENKFLADLTQQDKNIAEELRQEFLKEDSKKIEGFYQDLITSFADTNINVVILGIDKDRHVFRVIKGPEKLSGSHFTIGRGLAGKAFRSRKTQYYKREQPQYLNISKKILPYIEIVADGFNPDSALALPLMYPRIDNEKWDEIQKQGKEGRCPVFSVISLVADEPNFYLEEFGKEKESPGIHGRNLKLIEIYSGISKSLTVHFSELFSQHYQMRKKSSD